MTVHRIEPLWTVEDVAAFLGIPVNTLYQWRYRRTGRGHLGSVGTCGTTRPTSGPGSASGRPDMASTISGT